MKLKPIIQLRNVTRSFVVGGATLPVLKDINLVIHAGTIVAIMGASGSGKSTLLNILGCLDHASSGSYKVWGNEVKDMSGDQLALVRRKYFGFVFQRYHLLADLSAQGNVETPAIYAGVKKNEREFRAQKLLTELGLEDRLSHLPAQLSGGQQQRVSIARALMNGGPVIFADEPTGALDRESGIEMMRVLVQLNSLGHTIVIVTHDIQVASYAQRIIELSDGAIMSDRPNVAPLQFVAPTEPPPKLFKLPRSRSSKVGLFAEAFRMASIALLTHQFRTLLTLLGVVIGIISLVSIIAIGEGGQQHMKETLGTLTNNTIEIYRGTGWSDSRASQIRTLLPTDLDALGDLPYTASVTPMTKESYLLRYESLDSKAMVSGVSDSFFKTRNIAVSEGRSFNAEDIRNQTQVAVIDQATRVKLFAETGSPLGKTIVIGTIPCVVIGVTSAKSQDFYIDRGPNVMVPYTTAGTRLFGRQNFDSISIRIRAGLNSALAEKNINDVLMRIHGEKDFFTNNMDSMAKAYESTTRAIALMLSVIAAISLLVGGIGVMNIMLVSVSERTREIGIRMAVGARRSDIMKQFLVESIVVCLIGAVIGIFLSLLLGGVFSFFVKDWSMIFSVDAILGALASSILIGVSFGYLPARNASRLDPVEALSRD
jgi:macrolide transport system ATP-binding/permease protein